MGDDGAMAEAARDYGVAYAAHYYQQDFLLALQLYKKLIASHASARQAGYSRAQIRNIVKVVVPEQELLDAQVELALVCLERPISTDDEPIPVASPAPAGPRAGRMNPLAVVGTSALGTQDFLLVQTPISGLRDQTR
jgi:hypothetical protein